MSIYQIFTVFHLYMFRIQFILSTTLLLHFIVFNYAGRLEASETVEHDISLFYLTWHEYLYFSLRRRAYLRLPPLKLFSHIHSIQCNVISKYTYNMWLELKQ